MRFPQPLRRGWPLLTLAAGLLLGSCNHDQKKVDDDVPVEAADTLHTPAATARPASADTVR